MTQPDSLVAPTIHDHYTVELRRDVGEDQAVLRTHTADDVDGAVSFIEALRDFAHQRDAVTWQNEEVDAHGALFGLDPRGLVYEVHVSPPLRVALG